jgi:hypothetical protein
MSRNPFKKDFKPPQKATTFTRTTCLLDVCAYHEGAISPGSDIIECSHPHKPLHLHQVPCPLYRLDWQKQLKAQRPPEKKGPGGT